MALIDYCGWCRMVVKNKTIIGLKLDDLLLCVGINCVKNKTIIGLKSGCS
mgnify:CR=1 FL=1